MYEPFDDEYLNESPDVSHKRAPWWDDLKERRSQILANASENRNAANALYERVTSMKRNDTKRRLKIKRYEAFYNIDRAPVDDVLSAIAQSSWNVIRINANTAQSKLGKEMPKITFLTDKSMFHLRKATRALDQYIECEFERSELYENVRMAVLDACVGKLGTVKILFDEKKQRFQTHRVRPLDLIVDDNNQLYKRKKEVFEVKKVSKYFLFDKFKNLSEEQKKDIEKESSKGKVEVYEGYYDDKTHVTFCYGAVLKINSWKGMPPYFHWRWTQSTNSFWGVSIADELAPIQNRINDIMLKFSRGMDLVAVPRFLMNTHDNVTSSKITNEIGAVIKMTSSGDGLSKMDYLNPPPMNQMIVDHLETLWSKSFQITGISQLATSGEKPKGLDSGRALLAYHDINTDRFAQASQSLVDMYVDIARYMTVVADRHFSGKKGDLLPNKIDWKRIDIQKNIYQIRQYPTNLLSKSPAGRLEDVQILINLGIIPPEKGIQLLDFPDIQQAVDMLSATDQATEMLMDSIVEGETNVAPDPNLPMGRQIETAQKFYARAMVDGASDKVISQIQNFLIFAKEQVKKEIQEQQRAQGLATAAQAAGQDVQAPAGPMDAQLPGNLPMPPQGQQATTPLNVGGMR